MSLSEWGFGLSSIPVGKEKGEEITGTQPEAARSGHVASRVRRQFLVPPEEV